MKYKNKYLQVSCDGGAATGKSTGAKMIAKKYNLKFLSSGLLYRYASFLILKYKPKKNQWSWGTIAQIYIVLSALRILLNFFKALY